MRVTIARRHFYFHPAEVEQAMKGVVPEPVTGKSVDIGGVRYPIMQVGAVLTRQDRRDFNAGEVERAMRVLGFTVHPASP
ncbi:SCO5918 family protein [Actinacidiphila acididurans]|uniref:SCO5918 family protein n=1 Tax=Actinacidiphila acididurans TaxID=2784346 RepID=A0ABS2TLD3_9ACTN|nr:SCO5918 family protein [Actinacidiphila acididurans]MBM9504144.1 SCO5918 family protein [Actinacidiphila acididurans]